MTSTPASRDSLPVPINVHPARLAGTHADIIFCTVGKVDSPAHLPAGPCELAFAIQGRRFKDNGELFYPAFPGDLAHDDFIDPSTRVRLDEDPRFKCGGVSAFFARE